MLVPAKGPARRFPLKATTLASAPKGEPEDDRRSRRMRAFNPVFRDDISRLTQDSSALEDLADSFPGLLFALATGYATPARRRACIAAVELGAPLQRAAATLSLPWWLRKLPGHAFTHRITALPDNAEFSRSIVDLVPAEPERMGPWLWAIERGYRGCHWQFALWAARCLSKYNRGLKTLEGETDFRLLAAWAWHAGPGTHPSQRLLRKPWTETMGLRRAVDELGIWRRRMALAIALDDHPEPPWLREGSANGYDFVPLLTPEDFIRDSETMENCLDQFSDHLEDGASRIFSVRKKGRTVANLEISLHENEPSMPTIRQLRGRRNRKSRPEIWRATYAWLGSQPLTPRYMTVRRPDRSRAQRAAAELWGPYLRFLDAAGLSEEFATSVIGLKPASAKRVSKNEPSSSRAVVRTSQ